MCVFVDFEAQLQEQVKKPDLEGISKLITGHAFSIRDKELNEKEPDTKVVSVLTPMIGWTRNQFPVYASTMNFFPSVAIQIHLDSSYSLASVPRRQKYDHLFGKIRL